MFLDWVSVTIQGNQRVLLDTLQRYFKDWDPLNHGTQGYNMGASVAQSGLVLWHSQRADMGVHVRLPATALDALARDRIEVLSDLLRLGGKATRLDLAADDYNGLLGMRVIAGNVGRGELVLRSRQVIEYRALMGGCGHTINFGARESETFVRIYDKRAEQEEKGVDVSHTPQWIRVEMELKGDRAEAAGSWIVHHPDDWGITAAGWLLATLDFKMPGTDANTSRWETCPWWREFVHDAGKQQLISVQNVRTVETVHAWVEKQIAPSLFLLEATIGHDELFRMVVEGSARLTDRHKRMIEEWKARDPALPEL